VDIKKIFISLLYFLSIVVLAFALSSLFSDNERAIDLEYIMQEEAIHPMVLEEVYEKEVIGQNTSLVIIYFMNPFTCPVCMLEIDEFSALMATELRDIQYRELFAFNSDNQNAVNLFLHSGRYDHDYLYQLPDEGIDFLSSYGLRSQLIGQIIVMDVNKENVVSRAILESAEPTSHESKEGFIQRIKSLL
jgi:hypothetical protein